MKEGVETDLKLNQNFSIVIIADIKASKKIVRKPDSVDSDHQFCSGFIKGDTNSMRKRCEKYRGGRWLAAGLFSGVRRQNIRAFSEPMPCNTL
jgi:hypothetical protein